MMHFPEQYYVTLQDEGEGELPLGFAVPDGTDAAAIKRKATAIEWAKGWGRKGKTNTPLTLVNEPVDGYELMKSVKRTYYGGGNVVWRVKDPRGFQFEISSENLQAILEETSIMRGKIAGACILARNGAKNALVPVNSPEYTETVRGTRLKTNSTTLAKAPVGVMVASATQGTEYFNLGKVWVGYKVDVTPEDIRNSWGRRGTEKQRVYEKRIKEVVLLMQPGEHIDPFQLMSTSYKIGEVLEDKITPITAASVIANPKKFCQKIKGSDHDHIWRSTINAAVWNTLNLFITKAEAEAWLK